ncbi:hypothetical protein NECAME_08727 [Necator americanus]|uniref:Transcription factor CBF/NF-Y/archaeal histone domain-containing protein n=1 Tax=Necator americanus TaxID=51031 RepID=W2TIX2_NECAM|nr:hypothetical protein NECAME_08727 [Necator americanus]ETN81106.1 hypothetical protein NECAME_08727 [Necator americanus]
MSVEEIGTHEDVQLEQLLKCSLPTSRVKKICRLDPDLSMIGGDAILFLTKATELFLTELAKASYTQAVLEKRKTIQTKDLDKAIASKHMFEFLDDTLNDWPEAETSETFLQAKNRIEKSTIEEEDVVDGDVAEFLDDDLEVATGEFGEGHGLENDDGGVGFIK